MATKSVDQSIQDIDALLAKTTDGFVAALKPLTQKKLEPDQIYACIELFHMQNYCMNYNTFFVKDGKLHTEWNAFQNGASQIPDVNAYVEQHAGNLDWTEAQGIEFTEKHEAQLLKWFAQCWNKAGGKSCAVPTYFCFEKEYAVRDIDTGVIMEEDEAARKLGAKI